MFIKEGLSAVISNPGIVGEILNNLGPMPNIEMKAINAGLFWKNIDERNGWKFQKNIIFGNCRILDPGNIRKAWGGEKIVKEIFEAFVPK